jgi:HKD family nuclease
MKKSVIKNLVGLMIVYLMIVALYQTSKPLPEGVSIEGKKFLMSDEDVQFIYDLTYTKDGVKVYDHSIFNTMFELVRGADEFLLFDAFLFNSGYVGDGERFNITTQLKQELIEKKNSDEDIDINFISDPINIFYGSYVSEELEELKENGVNVIITDLTKVRDSNPVYSAVWRTYFQWFGSSGTHWVTNPIGGSSKVSLRAITVLLNTKANHRKVMVADSGDEMVTMISSANPHEASSTHSNIAFVMKNGIWRDVVNAENAVARFSGGELERPDFNFVKKSEPSGQIEGQLLTEGKIRDNLIKDIDDAKAGEEINFAMFYLSDRKVVKSLLRASERGVNVRLILDPNKDAFAREKNGVPNRPVAYELVKKSGGKIQVRWYDTQGEQFHSKLIVIRKSDRVIVYGGSANITRRNIGDYNIEANVKLISPYGTKLANDVTNYFDMLWDNEGVDFTLPFSAYEDSSFFIHLLYRFQEWSGFSSF